MRDIFFRAKSFIDGEWEHGYLSYSEQEDRYYIGFRELMTPVIKETIGQFTGLLDKKGIKIFEGDILRCVNPNDGESYITDFIASLVNGFTFKNTRLTRDLALYDNDWPDEIEVIGNIYDNSELINQ